jgi:glutathione S-transferase
MADSNDRKQRMLLHLLISSLILNAAVRAVDTLPIEFIGILSRQRSSSTYLCNTVADGLRAQPGTRVFDVGEPWLNAAEAPFNRPYDGLVNTTHMERMEAPLGYIRSLRAGLCRNATEKRCVLAFKLFDVHFTPYGTQDGWYRRVRPHQLIPLLAHPGGRFIVLEREPADEYCSLLFAQRSQQWYLPSTPKHIRDEYDSFRRHQCNASDSTPAVVFKNFQYPDWLEFSSHHDAWFNLLYRSIRSTSSAAARSMNATYNDNVERHDELISRAVSKLTH